MSSPVPHLSEAVQLGTAAEHLVCCDLLLAGYRAFMAGQGLPYDVLVDRGVGDIYRVQVKSSNQPARSRASSAAPSYRFHLKRQNRCKTRGISCDSVEILALVVLPLRRIAYFWPHELEGRDGNFVQTVDLRLRENASLGRMYPGGRRRKLTFARFLEDFEKPVRILG